VDDQSASDADNVKLGKNLERLLSAYDHTLKRRFQMWNESGCSLVKWVAEKMALVLVDASVMVALLRKAHRCSVVKRALP